MFVLPLIDQIFARATHNKLVRQGNEIVVALRSFSSLYIALLSFALLQLVWLPLQLLRKPTNWIDGKIVQTFAPSPFWSQKPEKECAFYLTWSERKRLVSNKSSNDCATNVHLVAANSDLPTSGQFSPYTFGHSRLGSRCGSSAAALIAKVRQAVFLSPEVSEAKFTAKRTYTHAHSKLI